MELKLNPPMYRVGEEVYLYEENSCCLVTIQDVYKWGDCWYYDIDASYYAPGFKLEFVQESALGKTTTPKCFNNPLPYMTMRRLYLKFKENQTI